jgi:hypothetical protein
MESLFRGEVEWNVRTIGANFAVPETRVNALCPSAARPDS